MKINFYKDKNGDMPVWEWMKELRRQAKTSKSARIQIEKIESYIDVLAERGTRAGEKYTKHLDGDIWELRPIENRILFFCWNGAEYIFLHYFTKKTQKTPKREIETAKRRMIETMKGEQENEE